MPQVCSKFACTDAAMASIAAFIFEYATAVRVNLFWRFGVNINELTDRMIP